MSKEIAATRLPRVKISLFALLILFSSCSQNNTSADKTVAGTDSIVMPRLTLLASLPDSNAPRIILTDTMPQPVNIAIGKNSSYTINTKSGPKKTALSKPQVHPLIDSVLHLPLAPEVHGSAFLNNYNSDNGLALDALPSALMDQSGNLWFGTYGGGVSRYEGKSFMSFSTEQGFVNNTIYNIQEDDQGNYWIGTAGGLSKLSKKQT